VLQFNRVDFRLPWLRRQFPRAKVLHLYRHPRDQWISSLVDPKEFTKDGTVTEFARHDRYYLRMWASDLKYHFPFLSEDQVEHPYQLFYYVWKLSYLFGQRFAHVSLAYESILESPERSLADLFEKLGIVGADPASLAGLVEKPRSGRWRNYAPEEWFRRHESSCETVLSTFLKLNRSA
jgi:hypothetical protein